MKSTASRAALFVTLLSLLTPAAVATTAQTIHKNQRECAALVSGKASTESEKLEVFEFKKSSFTQQLNEAAQLSDRELIAHIDALLERELEANDGMLTGIGAFHGGLKQFLFDTANAQTKAQYEAELANCYSCKRDPDLKRDLLASYKPRSKELLANYLGNALQTTLWRLATSANTIRVNVYNPRLGPQFGIEEYIYFKALIERLNSNPRRLYQAAGLSLPANTSTLTNSLERLNSIFGIDENLSHSGSKSPSLIR